MMLPRFAFPLGLLVGLPLVATLLGYSTWRQRQRLRWPQQGVTLTALRSVALLAAVLLIARPVLVESQDESPNRKTVVVLMDRSQSMAIEEEGVSRYSRALAFARRDLLPALERAGLKSTALLFAEDAVSSTGEELAHAVPDGTSTNLGRAIVHGLGAADPPPIALIALTDGAANDDRDNRRALTALAENRVPFVGVGFGGDTGPRTLTIQYVDAPPTVPPKQQFRIGVHLESGGTGSLEAFDLVLLRDGKLLDKKNIPVGPAGRIWIESFTVTEEQEGIRRYSVELLPPSDPSLRLMNRTATANVRIVQEKELRVLFVQSALTWDYKFIRLALHGDPTIRLTGLSRTSTSSVFYQNVDNSEELKGGFPTRLEDLAQFSVVVLSSIRHADLTLNQQELLTRFVGEFGGGLLMIGGPETFDGSWRDSRLEQLLAVRFAAGTPAIGDQPFQLALTGEALSHPVFKIGDGQDVRPVWNQVPPFTNYAVVDQAKPGAEVWATHPQQRGPHGPRVLMATQRFGAGNSAVICVQNFWRWRLAKDSDPRHFDRFWQQLLRHLAEAGRDALTVSLPDQSLQPPTDVRIQVARQPDPKNTSEEPKPYTVIVTDDQERIVTRQQLQLAPSRSVEASFRAETAGAYSILVQDAREAPLLTRTVEIRESNLEWQRAARDMDRLRQWAVVSDGLAVKAEECQGADDLVSRIIAQLAEARRKLPRREPIGINYWMLAILVGCLSGEWILRKRWGLL